MVTRPPIRKTVVNGDKSVDPTTARAISSVHSQEFLRTTAPIFRSLGTPYCKAFLENNVIVPERVLMAKFPDPSDYKSKATYARDYLAYNLLRKSDFIDVGIDKREKAKALFLENERICAENNRRLLEPCPDIRRDAIISIAKRKITRLIGRFRLDKVLDAARFSSGASTRLPRRKGDPSFKMTGKPHSTREAAHLNSLYLSTSPVFMESRAKVGPIRPKDLIVQVEGARVDFVPKTFKVDRTIAIEPEMNMFWQKGVGKLLRRAMLIVGIDLDDQSWNQYLALIGSRTGSLATLDQESASDCVITELVRALFDDEWFGFMDLVRSKRVLIGDEWHTLNKFSSMGNGFTFELESLIFWALTEATRVYYSCDDRRIGIIGDDIVCHNSYATPLMEILSLVGFRSNKEKTFISGPFRESCGKHYWHGEDVTPFNLKTLNGDVTDELHRYNSLLHWSLRTGVVLSKCLDRLLSNLDPKTRRMRVPSSYGVRAGVHEPSYTIREDMYIRFYVYASKDLRAPQEGAYMANLVSMGETRSEWLGHLEKGRSHTIGEDDGRSVIRRPLKKLRIKRAKISYWD